MKHKTKSNNQNKLFNIKRLLLTACLSLSCIGFNQALAQSRNTVIEDSSEHQFGSANPILLNDLIIYQTIEQTQDSELNHLWSYNTQTKEKIMFFTGGLIEFNNTDEYLYTIGGYAYFVSGAEDAFLYWKSDGTVAGTAPLDSRTLYPLHSKEGDYLYSWTNNSSTISTDGVDVFEHPISTPSPNHFCAFDNRDIIVVDDQFGPGEMKIIRSNEGVLTALSDFLPEELELRKASLIKYGDQCLVLAGNYEASPELMLVSKNGTVELISEQFSVSDVVKVIVFKGRVYAITYDNNYSASIKRINHNLTGYDAQFDYPAGFSSSRITKTSNDYIISNMSTRDTSPTFSKAFYLNENLELQESLTETNTIPSIYQTAAGELFTSRSYLTNYQFTLYNELGPIPDNAFNVSKALVKHVITSENSSDIYLEILEDYGNSSIVKVADTPDINYSTAGNWFNPAVKNQGLLITRGQRANGSSYLFVSVFTQDAGLPLWLAGAANIELPQSSIDIELTYYEGTDFFETETETIKTVWGNVKVEMTSCNGLRATFTRPDLPSRNIDLIRIDNTQYNHLCFD